VLLCLVEGTIGEVHLHEPPVGLHFGLDVDEDDKILTTKHLRSLDGAAVATRTDTPANIAFHSSNDRVLNLATTAANMQAELGVEVPADALALQLVEGVQSVRFVRTGS